ncbi:MAG: hypothetical protein QNJ68_11620 [Microcoleaceae cyanobacterium MO_207.B10]|nr:hypothetical protein [Microcoleaceae cyanobacterium MO_207.B10]
MNENIIELYEPINIPKKVDKNIWIVDSGILKMAMYGTKIPFPRPMTIVQ